MHVVYISYEDMNTSINNFESLLYSIVHKRVSCTYRVFVIIHVYGTINISY